LPLLALPMPRPLKHGNSDHFLTDHSFTIEATKQNMLQDNCRAVNLVQSKANMH
jgi:hypothetical protein